MASSCGSEDVERVVQFHEMGLDDRILKAISKLGWSTPTLIQERAIPLALSGKDVLARARTGSGKTAAYIIPIVQRLLHQKQMCIIQEVTALVLAPSKELCKQIQKNFMEITSSCSRDIRCVDVSGQGDLNAHRPLLMEKPDVIIGTPSRVLAHIRGKNLSLDQTIEQLVIDEADLLFAFGFEGDMKAVLSHLPNIYQAFLMSATLNDGVQSLKKLVLHNPVILKLEEPELPESDQLTQYHIKCEEEDKFVLIYALFKLGLIRGRTIVFVSTVNRCYRVKLYLEQFGIKSCALNAELPINSRCHIISQFNDGMYDIIVASDEQHLEGPNSKPTTIDKDNTAKKRKRDEESGIARGIDFQSVSNIINFDFPPDVDSYVHRVGRTARGKNVGTALSFISRKEIPLMESVESVFAEHTTNGSIFKPFQFKMEELAAFRYRARDANRSVTTIAVREARLKEIKRELLASQKLKSYFEDNPRDFQVLRHDKALHTIRLQHHLKDVPNYIVPETLQKMVRKKASRPSKQKRAATTLEKGKTKGQLRYLKEQSDPLKSFKFTGFKKQKPGSIQ